MKRKMQTINDRWNPRQEYNPQKKSSNFYDKYKDRPDPTYAMEHGIDDWTRFYEEYFLYYLLNCNMGRDTSSLCASQSIRRLGCDWEKEQLVNSLKAKHRYPNSEYLNRVKRTMVQNGVDSWQDVLNIMGENNG